VTTDIEHEKTVLTVGKERILDGSIPYCASDLFAPQHYTLFPKKSIMKTTHMIDYLFETDDLIPRTDIKPYSNEHAETSTSSGKTMFCPTTQVHFITSLLPVKREVWWGRTDIKRFGKSAEAIAQSATVKNREKLHMNDEQKSTIKDAIRGLEHMTSIKYGKKREKKRQQTIKAVIMEQEHWKKRGKECDALTLAKVSFRHSQWSREIALAAGFADAEAVEKDTGNVHRDDFLLKKSSNAKSETFMWQDSRNDTFDVSNVKICLDGDDEMDGSIKRLSNMVRRIGTGLNLSGPGRSNEKSETFMWQDRGNDTFDVSNMKRCLNGDDEMDGSLKRLSNMVRRIGSGLNLSGLGRCEEEEEVLDLF